MRLDQEHFVKMLIEQREKFEDLHKNVNRHGCISHLFEISMHLLSMFLESSTIFMNITG